MGIKKKVLFWLWNKGLEVTEYRHEFNTFLEKIDSDVKEKDQEITTLKKAIEILRASNAFYVTGTLKDDLEILPEKKELWSIPEKWSLRSMSDFYSGKRARQAEKEVKELLNEK